MLLFSLRDIKAETYGRPFTSVTRGTAMREVSASLLQDKNMSDFAEDFQLFEVGQFDEFSGTVHHQDPSHVINVSELLTPEREAQPALREA